MCETNCIHIIQCAVNWSVTWWWMTTLTHLPPHASNKSEDPVGWWTFEILDSSNGPIVLPLWGIQFNASPITRSKFSLADEPENSFTLITNQHAIPYSELERLDRRITAYPTATKACKLIKGRHRYRLLGGVVNHRNEFTVLTGLTFAHQ